MDEEDVLEYGEIFFQSTSGATMNSAKKTNIIIGKVFVVRSPAIFPGDVRVLTAVDKPGIFVFLLFFFIKLLSVSKFLL
jgi:hypothetical protein